MNTLALLNGLRFVDSFFPSGGYAFSSGLEAAVQGGAVGMRRAEEERAGIGERERLRWDSHDAPFRRHELASRQIRKP
jgi:urease accessory protein